MALLLLGLSAAADLLLLALLALGWRLTRRLEALAAARAPVADTGAIAREIGALRQETEHLMAELARQQLQARRLPRKEAPAPPARETPASASPPPAAEERGVALADLLRRGLPEHDIAAQTGLSLEEVRLAAAMQALPLRA